MTILCAAVFNKNKSIVKRKLLSRGLFKAHTGRHLHTRYTDCPKLFQPTPPQYEPEKVHVPVVAYSSGHDILADPTDVAWLLQRLTPSLLASHYIPHWDHLDFIWAFDSPVYCYNDIISWVLHD